MSLPVHPERLVFQERTPPQWVAPPPDRAARRMAGMGLMMLGLWALEVFQAEIPGSGWMQFGLASTILILGSDALRCGIEGLFVRFRLEPESLQSLGAAAAFCHSFVNLLLASIGQLGMQQGYFSEAQGFRPALHFATAGTLVWALCAARFLGARAAVALQKELDASAPSDAGVEGPPDVLEPGSDVAAPAVLETPEMEEEEAIEAGPASRIFRWVPVLAAALAIAQLALAAGSPSGWSHGAFTSFIGLLAFSCPGVFEEACRCCKKLGLGRMVRSGFKLKKTSVLDRLSRVDTVCFNKFGTFTTGCPQVTDIVPAHSGISPEEVVYLASILELQTNHPIRDALLLRSSENCRTIPQAKGYRFLFARGVEAMYQGHELVLGSAGFLEQLGIDIAWAAKTADGLTVDGKTVLVLARDHEVLGVIGFTDDRRAEAQDAVAGIHKLGIRTIVLSGDQPHTVNALTWDLGLEQVHAGLTPEQASERIRELKSSGRRLAFVGSGVNYAAAMALADVSIAFGAGSVQNTLGTIKTADVRLERRDLLSIGDILGICRETRRVRSRALLGLGAIQLFTFSLAIWLFSAISFPAVARFTGFQHSRETASWMALGALPAQYLPAFVGVIAALSRALPAWLAFRMAVRERKQA